MIQCDVTSFRQNTLQLGSHANGIGDCFKCENWEILLLGKLDGLMKIITMFTVHGMIDIISSLCYGMKAERRIECNARVERKQRSLSEVNIPMEGICPIQWSQALSREWRCRRCSNYIWVIDNFIAYKSAPYFRDLTVYCRMTPQSSGRNGLTILFS